MNGLNYFPGREDRSLSPRAALPSSSISPFLIRVEEIGLAVLGFDPVDRDERQRREPLLGPELVRESEARRSLRARDKRLHVGVRYPGAEIVVELGYRILPAREASSRCSSSELFLPCSHSRSQASCRPWRRTRQRSGRLSRSRRPRSSSRGGACVRRGYGRRSLRWRPSLNLMRPPPASARTFK